MARWKRRAEFGREIDLDAVRLALAEYDDERAFRLIAESGRDADLYRADLYHEFRAPRPPRPTPGDRVEQELQRIISHAAMMRL